MNKIVYTYNHEISQKLKNNQQSVESWYEEGVIMSKEEFAAWLIQKKRNNTP